MDTTAPDVPWPLDEDGARRTDVEFRDASTVRPGDHVTGGILGDLDRRVVTVEPSAFSFRLNLALDEHGPSHVLVPRGLGVFVVATA